MYFEIKTDQRIKSLNIVFSDDGGADISTSAPDNHSNDSKPEYIPNSSQSLSKSTVPNKTVKDNKPSISTDQIQSTLREPLVDPEFSSMNF